MLILVSQCIHIQQQTKNELDHIEYAKKDKKMFIAWNYHIFCKWVIYDPKSIKELTQQAQNTIRGFIDDQNHV